MPRTPATNSKTKQMVTRIPIPMVRMIEMLARQNAVTTTAVVNKLIAVGLGRLPPEVSKRMDDEIARQATQEREHDATEAEAVLRRWTT